MDCAIVGRGGAADKCAIPKVELLSVAIADDQWAGVVAGSVYDAIIERQTPFFIARCRTAHADEPGSCPVPEPDSAQVQFGGIRTGEQIRVFADRGQDHRPGYILARQVEPFAIARSEEHTSELQSLMRISYAVFCLKKK